MRVDDARHYGEPEFGVAGTVRSPRQNRWKINSLWSLAIPGPLSLTSNIPSLLIVMSQLNRHRRMRNGIFHQIADRLKQRTTFSVDPDWLSYTAECDALALRNGDRSHERGNF